MDKILGDPRVVFDECELCVTSYRDECVLLVVMIRWVEEVLVYEPVAGQHCLKLTQLE